MFKLYSKKKHPFKTTVTFLSVQMLWYFSFLQFLQFDPHLANGRILEFVVKIGNRQSIKLLFIYLHSYWISCLCICRLSNWNFNKVNPKQTENRNTTVGPTWPKKWRNTILLLKYQSNIASTAVSLVRTTYHGNKYFAVFQFQKIQCRSFLEKLHFYSPQSFGVMRMRSSTFPAVRAFRSS